MTGESLHIVVMRGGPSAERDVSLRSGAAVAAALRGLGHFVTELDPRDQSWDLPAQTDVVFVVLHGSYGEDGEVQARLELLGVPYTGCGVEASKVAFDKVLSKERLRAAGVETPRYEVIRSPGADWPGDWEPPVVLKPVRQGSSFGLQFVNAREDWQRALQESFRYDSEVLMEERIWGRETTVGIFGDELLPLVEVRPKAGAYDYQNKYTAGATDYFCPAEFSEEQTRRIQEAGKRAFEAVGGRDYGRVDVMVSEKGVAHVLEINTLPGMTETSLLPKAAAVHGISYEEMCQRMVLMAMGRNTRTRRN